MSGLGGCPLDMCSGNGLIEVPDFTGSQTIRCACYPSLAAERRVLVLEAEERARRRDHELRGPR